MAILDKERSINLYNADSYKENTTDWEDDVSEFRADAFLLALEKAGLLGQLSSILDVGCGSGGVLARMAQDKRLDGVSLRGIDISEAAIEISRRLARKKMVDSRIEYSLQTITDIDPSQKVTVISLIHVMEHCPDIFEMLEACASRSDYQYINVPLEFNLFYALRSRVPERQYERYGHLHFFDEGFFLKWLSNNGYELIAKAYSQDYMIKKPGIAYNCIKTLRKFSQRVFGPLATIKYLAGLSGGYLVRKN
jgi:SAM-dependent methyltransferase